MSNSGTATSSTIVRPRVSAESTAQVQVQRERRQEEPERHRAGVAEEDPGRREVEAQEPEARAGHRERERPRVVVALLRGRERDPERGDERDPAGEPVHVVDHVHRVDQRDHPDHRQHEVERRDPEHAGPHADEPQRDPAGRLGREPEHRGEAPEVVDDPHGAQEHRAEQDHEQLALGAGRDRGDQQQPAHHRRAAQRGGGQPVRAVPGRLVHEADPARDPGRERGQRHRRQRTGRGRPAGSGRLVRHAVPTWPARRRSRRRGCPRASTWAPTR